MTGILPLSRELGRDATASPVLSFLDHLHSHQDNRHSWLHLAGQQARQMNRDSEHDA